MELTRTQILYFNHKIKQLLIIVIILSFMIISRP